MHYLLGTKHDEEKISFDGKGKSFSINSGYVHIVLHIFSGVKAEGKRDSHFAQNNGYGSSLVL